MEIRGKVITMTKLNGIDVSGYQGRIDFKKVKASGVDFVIIKAGYHLDTVETWENNYANAKNSGLKVGAYWYSAALTLDGIRAEANAFICALKGKQLDFPVYLDLEEQKQFDKGVKFCTDAVRVFCSEMEKAGYFVGLYMSRYYLENYISPDVRKKYALWIAEYSSKCRYNDDFGIWQYDKAIVPGVENVCDRNFGYIDYSPIIKNGGFNGYAKNIVGQAPAAEKSPKTDIKVGSKVMVKKGAKTYDGKCLASFVFGRQHTVTELVGDRAVICYDNIVVAAVNIKNLILV